MTRPLEDDVRRALDGVDNRTKHGGSAYADRDAATLAAEVRALHEVERVALEIVKRAVAWGPVPPLIADLIRVLQLEAAVEGDGNASHQG